MALIEQSRKEKRDRAENQDIQKRVVESSVAIELAKFFRNVGDQFEAVFATSGNIILLDNYAADLISILNSGARQSTYVFAAEYLRMIEDVAENDKSQEKLANEILTARNNVDKQILAILTMYYLTRNKTQANVILQNTAQIMADKVNSVIADAASAGKRLNNVEIATAARDEIDKANEARTPVISETETQANAEKAKQVEVEETQKKVDKEIQQRGKITKEWITMGDKKVRDAHKAADGQSRMYDQPYSVMNESLMFPGDMSLGASLINIIGCRCVSLTN